LRYISIPLAAILSSSIWPICSAAVHTATSPELKDVQKAIDTAHEGDTVIVPAGTATWNAPLKIDKNLTVQGAGIGKTILQDGGGQEREAGRRGGGGGGGGGRPSMLNVQLSKDAPLFRLTGIEFRGLPTSNQRKHLVASFKGGSTAGQKPLVLGITSNFRLDHCKLSDVNGLGAIFTNLIGVVDHLEYVGRGDFCFVQHPNWGGHEMGHGSWAQDAYWGSNKFLFFEDCDFTNTGTGVPYGFDAFLGARYVVRYCRFHGNTGVTGHGTETPQRGTKQIEIYKNSFNFPAGSETGFPQLRGGSVLFHDNKFKNCKRGMSLRVYRQMGYYSAAWGVSNGTNKWDENDEHPAAYASGVVTGVDGRTLTDSQNAVGGAKNWREHQFNGIEEGASYIIKNMSARPLNGGDPKQTFLVDSGRNTLIMGSAHLNFKVGDRYEVWKVKSSLDQPGMGKGALLSGNAKYGGVVFAETGTPGSWPQRGFPREPCYAWNNVNETADGELVQLRIGSEQHSVKEGRDYFNYGDVGDKPQQIGPPGRTYTYTPYPYPHPLQKQQGD
jgi:hypothetical protein